MPSRSTPHVRRRAAFSLLEVSVALIVLAILMALAVTTAERPPEDAVEDGAQQFARSLQRARIEALANPGWIRLYVEPTAGSDTAGRSIAVRVPVGADTTPGTAADSGQWVSLSGGAVFGVGAAAGLLGPMGDSALTGVPVTMLRCDPLLNRCAYNGVDSLSASKTFYITHKDFPDRVRAIVLAQGGFVRIYRLRGTTWE